MKDQAERLRQIVYKSKEEKINIKKNKRTNQTRVLTVTSGKGGVGKTNFTVNVAISLSKLGYKVIVFDADIGFANVDILLGIVPKYTIADVIKNEMNILDVLIDGPNGIKIISGGSGVKELISLDKHQLESLANQMLILEDYADFIIIDTGAGLSNIVLTFINAAKEIILVTTPEPTSLTDSYAMIKALSLNGKGQKLNVVINRVKDNIEGVEIYNKLHMVVDRFLGLSIENLGYIQNTKLITESIKKQNPLSILYPESSASRRINGIALRILGDKKDEDESGFIGFINRFKSLISREGDTIDD